MSSEIKESCGVFGILKPSLAKPGLSEETLLAKNLPEKTNLGQLIFYGLYALQHRGQESCGMAVFDQYQLRLHKEMGLVNQVFTHDILTHMTGQLGIGHTRYSTSGSTNLENAQPVVVQTAIGAVTVAHNGNLINTESLRDFLLARGYHSPGDSDSHWVAQRIRYELDQIVAGKQLPADSLHESALFIAVQRVIAVCEGAFSILFASGDTLIACRDRHGLRPLSFGQTESGMKVFASETCALNIVGAEFVRDVRPGELVAFNLDGHETSILMEGEKAQNMCIFEFVYFARPDSQFNQTSIYQYRLGLGRRLAEISPKIEADFVIPVPDSGNVAAVGYSQASGLPYMEGLIKNRYVGRTFINPSQELRERGIQLKLNPLTDLLKGQRIVVIDDSIVRGNTSKKIVQMLWDCGVKEIHLRVSSAPVKHPCFYGIDMSTPDQLIANQMEIEAIREWLGVNTLVYLSVEDMKAVAQSNSQQATPYCTACFSGQYPAGQPQDFLTISPLLSSTV